MFSQFEGVCTMLWGDRTLITTAITLGLPELVAKLKDATPDETLKAIARDIHVMVITVSTWTLSTWLL